MPHNDETGLPGLLHAEADRHHPDSSAMWDRIERDRSRAARGPMARIGDLFRRPAAIMPRPLAGLLRPVGAAAAVAGVLVAGGTGVRMANRSPAPEQAAAAPSTTATAPQKSRAPTSKQPSSPSHSARPTGAATSSSPHPVRDGYLSATAVRNASSGTYWTSNDLMLGSTETIKALDVTIRVAITAGVTDTGQWTSIPPDKITKAVSSQDGTLVYRFTLKDGATLAPGSYTFAAQFNHAADPRPLTVDSYTVRTTADRTADVTGSFSKT